MTYRFGIILTVTLVVFTTMISVAISIFNHIQLREQAIQYKSDQVQHNELMAIHALQSIEKAYHVFGNQLTAKMKMHSYELLDLYDRYPSFEEWDFAKLRDELSMDIYILDDSNVIIYSSFEQDIGLDFKKSPKFSAVLDQRREDGGFFHDGIDVEQHTGKLKKYSYIATPDKKYIIQLGYYLEDDDIFQTFNFLEAIDRIMAISPSIKQINVLNPGGYVIGKSFQNELQIQGERRKYLEETLRTGQTNEFRGMFDGEPAIYRYVLYESEYDEGLTKNKGLEIIYNEQDLEAVLSRNLNNFLIQLLFILLCTLVISLIITKWVAKPLYYAVHDSLTRLKNRAYMDQLFKKIFKQKEEANTALLLIDLDNFKWINDHYGHDQGDHILIQAARHILQAARKKDIAVRLGGDEFLLVMPSVSQEEARQTAHTIITGLRELSPADHAGTSLTASIGIAYFPEHGTDQETLLKAADIALYASKQKGKNQYHEFHSNLEADEQKV